MIIAIIPAPGHEALVAEGPMGERPALLTEAHCVTCGRPTWTRRCCPPSPGGYALRLGDYSRVALVLHAPGNPRLGMLRAMESLGPGEMPAWSWTQPPDLPVEASPAWGLAHLLVQRGIAAEVIVLPADKAKE